MSRKALWVCSILCTVSATAQSAYGVQADLGIAAMAANGEGLAGRFAGFDEIQIGAGRSDIPGTEIIVDHAFTFYSGVSWR